VNISGEIYTFYRGCTPYGDEGVQDGGGYRVYTRVCTSNLCNYWDGISSSPSGGSGSGSGSGDSGYGSGADGGGSGGGDGDYGGILRFPGIGGAGTSRGILYASLISIAIVMILFY
jgi:hypothetical protein